MGGQKVRTESWERYRKDKETGKRIRSHKGMIDFCNLSVQGGKSAYHTTGKTVKKVEWFLPRGSTEDWKTLADLFQYLHPSLFPDLNEGLHLQVTNTNESPEIPVTVHGTVLTAHLGSWKHHSFQDVGFTKYPEAPLAQTPHSSKTTAPLQSHRHGWMLQGH